MADQPRSPVPQNRTSYRPNGHTDMTPPDEKGKKQPQSSQVDIIALVRSLQRSAGMADCFRTGNADCDAIDCEWRAYCLDTAIDRVKNAKGPQSD